LTKYRAFISYNHRDGRFASRLHRRLESVAVPKAYQTEGTGTRLRPVFLDRQELRAGPDLGHEITAALRESAWLVVVCSPASVASDYVRQEIQKFKAIHGPDRIAPIIVSGEPYSGGDQECIPAALRFESNPDGTLSDVACAPVLAADARPEGDGFANAALKVAASLIGSSFDELRHRRLQQQMRLLAAAMVAAMVVAVGLAAGYGLAIYNGQLAQKRLDAAVAYALRSSEQVLDLQQGLGLRGGAAKVLLADAEARLTGLLNETASETVASWFDSQASTRIVKALAQTLLNYCEIELEDRSFNDKSRARLKLVEDALTRVGASSSGDPDLGMLEVRTRFVDASASMEPGADPKIALAKFEAAAAKLSSLPARDELVASQILRGLGLARIISIEHAAGDAGLPDELDAAQRAGLDKARATLQLALKGFEALAADLGHKPRVDREVFATHYHLADLAGVLDGAGSQHDYLEDVLVRFDGLPDDIRNSVGLLYERFRLGSAAAGANAAARRYRKARQQLGAATSMIARLIALDPDNSSHRCDLARVQWQQISIAEQARYRGWRRERRWLNALLVRHKPERPGCEI
jgi:hypothetical protein